MITRTKFLRIDSRFLMIPQSADEHLEYLRPEDPIRGYKKNEGLAELSIKIEGRTVFSQKMTLKGGRPWWWAALDVSRWQRKTIELRCTIPEEDEGAFAAITLGPDLSRIPDLHHEADRPQFHFSYRHGVMGDPTAMVYYPPRAEWHLFTIHNPFRGWETCWGHAVSKDLLHWEERAPVFHHPHYIFNGAGFTDTRNLLGLNRGGEQAMVLLTPLMDAETRHEIRLISMLVSLDGGHAFHEINRLKIELHRDDLPENPIVPGRGDAPRIWWNPVAKRFFLTHCRWLTRGEERLGRSLQYISASLREWVSIEDFPLLIFDNWPGEGDANDVIELPLDGNEDEKIVLIMPGRNGYALGRYTASGLDNLRGEPLSPTDTIATGHFGYPIIFSNAPGGRGVIMYNVGNDRVGGIPNYEIGYKPNVSFPLELTVRSTPSGPRLYQSPVSEIEQLYGTVHRLGDLIVADRETSVDEPDGGLYRMQAIIDAGSADEVDLVIMGYTITYNASNATIGAERDEMPARHSEGLGTRSANGHHFISQEGRAIRIDLLIDRTSIELFPNDGERYIYYGRLKLYEHSGDYFAFAARGGEAVVRELTITEINSIW